jgi:ATP-dependent Clp protease ATP-binding subunit ClpB
VLYGARPLKRVIQHYIQNYLAEMMLSGELQAGSNIRIDSDGNTLIFSVVVH